MKSPAARRDAVIRNLMITHADLERIHRDAAREVDAAVAFADAAGLNRPSSCPGT